MMRFFLITIALLFVMSGLSSGAGPKISENGNKHNFSSTNTGVNYRAIATGDSSTYPRSSQICVFCHTPHHASGDGPLWNRRASIKSFFQHFSSPTLAIDDATVRGSSSYGQPNGSSKLCLSCHDGVTALGAVFTTPMGAPNADIQFIDVKRGQSGVNVTLGYETYSSHHPVSFKYDGAVIGLLNTSFGKNMHYSPPSSNEVKLDKDNRMQCTTCHDPHQDKSDIPNETTPFWTSGTYVVVCEACHNVTPVSVPWMP